MSDSDLIPAMAMAAADASTDMKPIRFKRRKLADFDIHFEVKFCGVCHSDLHFAHNDLGNSTYPMVPGHELAGVVVKVGSAVTKFAAGDHIGVGCFVDSCLECRQCKDGCEQYCTGMQLTYGGKNVYGRCGVGEQPNDATFGGYSTQMVIHERFAVKIPKSYPLDKAGPLLCAAITMYDPLKHWNMKEGSRVGIVGLGGLGQMGVKIAKAMGCTVTVLSRGEGKKDFAKKIGADHFVSSSDAEQIKAAAKSLDLLLNTVSANHEVSDYLGLLDVNGVAVQLGLALQPHSLSQLPLMFGRLSVAGSIIGGIAAQQECVDFCAEKSIMPDVEIRPVQDLNRIFESLHQGNDSGVRYVIDLSTLNEKTEEACKGVAPPKLD